MRGRLFGLAVVVLALAVPVWAFDDNVEARMRKDITFLASDECEGRGVATQGINKAADYIAAEFKKAGLKPGDGKSYFQSFTISGGTLEGTPKLSFRDANGKEIVLKVGEQFEGLGMSQSGKLDNVPVVFVGYGITAKESAYDEYRDVDVAGKLVIVLRNVPRPNDKAMGLKGDRQRFASFTEKLVNADKHKAAAVLFVNDAPTAGDKDEALLFSYTAPSSSPVKLPAFHVRRDVVEELLKAAKKPTLAEIEKKIDQDFDPQSAPLNGWTASVELKVRRSLDVKNVVGILEGKGPLANETVVVGAHYDHLGYGGGGSLANLRKPAIHHGADDNGSGTTTVIELARRFGAMKDREGRRLVFITFTGEEMGLLGSQHYAKEPLVPLADTVAMVNLDMVGRLRPDKTTKKDKLLVYGTGTAKNFDALIEQLNGKYDFTLKKIPSGYGPSDHTSFYAKKVPVFFFFTDDHGEYHRPTDTANLINVAGMKKVANLTEDLVTELATSAKRPEYVEIKQSTGGAGAGNVPRIGIRPAYGDDKGGVLLEGVVAGGPADKAGLKEGDRILELNGKEVKNLEGYMTLIRAAKKGDAIDLTVQRDGKKVSVKVKPE